MIFTYHRSRVDGWVSVYTAIHADFRITQVIPVKAEMYVPLSIQAAKMPIHYNLVFVCRKSGFNAPNETHPMEKIIAAINDALLKIGAKELNFSKGDRTVLLYGHGLKYLSFKGATNVTTDDIGEVINTLLSNSALSKHI